MTGGPDADLSRAVAAAAVPLPELDDPAFAAAVDRYADARVVLLGEASHGTAEFYRARAAITQRLIERHGFRIVAVEADWPDAAVLDRYARGLPRLDGADPPFARFPTWMWRNTEVAAFLRGMRDWNEGDPPGERAGFFGLDLYNLSASIRAVLDYLDRVDPEAAAVARERYGCIAPFAERPELYGRSQRATALAKCEDAVARTLRDMLEHRGSYGGEGDEFLDATANARLVRDAEGYYRAMYAGGAESWNLRDRHMFETLCTLLESRGPGAKAVVWAHNSHIGDAAATEMGWSRGELNLGQLCRERFGSAAALIGFGTHAGHVTCATDWDGPTEVKRVNPSRPGSVERVMHDTGLPRFLLDLRDDVPDGLSAPRLERFIGVIYRPETERWSHYMEAALPRQFDGWIWLDETSAVTPVPGPERPGAEETFPTGF
ncbi:erythromycin esterase family protein [Roseomonas sp. CCTCC AB2023176]|uniref:erythromycin esterase family protein n=1 Tax=Roseomonas sp. CCTCC AB2023176 TaxID=3342640 RepID=UPI0035DF1F53